jgi:2-hydroxy-6-oxonona-2,4-dienedioate hydrolase
VETIWSSLFGVELRQAYHSAGGLRIRCLEAGSGPPLLLLHGGGGHAESYARNIGPLSRHFHVYAVDMPGHGLSDRPEGTSYGFEELVHFVKDFQSTIAASKMLLSGMSIGAMTAGLYAGRYPERVARLLLNTGVPLPADEKGRIQFSEGLKRAEAACAEGWTYATVRRRLAGMFYGGENEVPDELIRLRLRIYLQPGMGLEYNKIVNGMLKQLIEPSSYIDVDGRAALRNITAPTLLVWTEKNPGQGVGVAQEALGLLRNGRLEIFNQSAHWPQWEEADKFNELAIRFFSEADG